MAGPGESEKNGGINLKVAISSTGPDMDSPLDQRFGRCEYFLIIDLETKETEAVENPGMSAFGGSGISASQFLQDKGVDVVVTGNVGPNAHKALSAAGIRTMVGATGTVRNALDSCKKGLLNEAKSPTVSGHFGQGSRR